MALETCRKYLQHCFLFLSVVVVKKQWLVKWKSIHAKLPQSYLTLCDPMDHSLPGLSVHGILPQEYWSRLSCPPLGDLPSPGIETNTLWKSQPCPVITRVLPKQVKCGMTSYLDLPMPVNDQSNTIRSRLSARICDFSGPPRWHYW